MKNIKIILLCLLSVNLYACTTTPEQKIFTPKKETTKLEQASARTLILNGVQFNDNNQLEKFTSWKCSDYSNGGKTLVEVGKLKVPDNYKDTGVSIKEDTNGLIKMLGFILYDGTNTGEITLYKRRGINHRWDWGDEGSYSFIIKPDGTGLFYDFSTAKNGENIKADDIYKCHR